MKKVYAYVRVSTKKQGTYGSSLIEQRAAIETYVGRNNLEVVEWFEEVETAAKRGRPIFVRMMRGLEKGHAQGVVIHKIDRSARNMRDWAEINEFIDRGIEVHFAHESIDLGSRGGRLSADIQAVVAADFIRNLRQELRKGFYGRLKQGLYPIGAPIGYRDMGKAKAKEIDPLRGPLVRQAFELYATGEFNFDTLKKEMTARGLRGRRGNILSKNGFTTMLNNPFYMGIIHLRTTGETFEGKHAPLITKALYDQVQSVLRGNRPMAGPYVNHFLFRRLIRCVGCNRHLIGERKKQRYIYYRCHDSSCGPVCLNERRVESEIKTVLALLHCEDEEVRDIRDIAERQLAEREHEKQRQTAAVQLNIVNCDDRLNRLTDALVNGLIDKVAFDPRRSSILAEKCGFQETLNNIAALPSPTERALEKLELANTAYNLYEIGIPSEKRDVLQKAMSNFLGERNNPVITLKSPLRELAEWRKAQCCGEQQDTPRTRAEKILNILMKDNDAQSAGISPRSP
ncbi:MAG TPA: recombinase family protein [Rhizomicrobium sp.]|jgi:site-specific DNA recombinase|nr:recombinase family protein [Rhizomicrobium sp.]